jgi:hypothetical protein
VSEFYAPEVAWVDAHHDELIGLLVEDAVGLVRAAGFQPTAYVLETAPTVAANYVNGHIRLFSRDGRIARVSPG